ncbi:hypothetical protein SGRIM128S_02628 [Streptomyces griseomycini]
MASRRARSSAETARRWRGQAASRRVPAWPPGGDGGREGVDDLDGPQPLQHRAVRDEGAHPEAGRGRLGQRADVHHDPVGIVGGERARQRTRVLVHQPPDEVVLDHEGARRAGDGQHLAAPVGCEHGARGVLEQRLADEDPGAGRPERVREQRGPHAVRVHRDGHRAQSGRAGDGQHARVGGRLDQDGRAGRRECAQGGGQRGLPARGDQHPRRRDRSPDTAREPLAQLRQPLDGRPPPGARPAPGPGQRRRHRPLRLQGGVQIAAVELDHPGRRRGERDQHPGGVHRARHEVGGAVRAEGDLLPGGVPGGSGRDPGLRAEGAGAGPGDHQPLGGELRQCPGDGHGAHPEPLHQGPTGRELSTR